jgi:hypothetical protein
MAKKQEPDLEKLIDEVLNHNKNRTERTDSDEDDE